VIVEVLENLDHEALKIKSHSQMRIKYSLHGVQRLVQYLSAGRRQIKDLMEESYSSNMFCHSHGTDRVAPGWSILRPIVSSMWSCDKEVTVIHSKRSICNSIFYLL